MANTQTVLLRKILARGLMALRERVIMPRLVNSDFSSDAVQKGNEITIPLPAAVADQAVTPSNTSLAPTDVTPTSAVIALDQWRQSVPLGITDKEKTEVATKDDFLPMQLSEAIKGLANTLNQYIWGKYTTTTSGIYGFISNPSVGYDTILEPFGTGTTDTSGTSAATNAKRVLNQQLCPRNDRRGVLSFNAEAAMLDLGAISDAEKIGSSDVKITGEVGRKFGIDWFADDHIPDHTVGTSYVASPSVVTIGAAASVDATSVDIRDSDDNGGTLVAGDILTFAGDSQTYCVTGSSAPYTLTATETLVTIVPALKVALLTSAEVVTIKNSHAVNLVFHRDAFGFAMRVLELDITGRTIATQTDPVTGLTLRLEVIPQHKQTTWSFDILYGAQLVRPELAMRIAGAV